jgi:hypothetical protein
LERRFISVYLLLLLLLIWQTYSTLLVQLHGVVNSDILDLAFIAFWNLTLLVLLTKLTLDRSFPALSDVPFQLNKKFADASGLSQVSDISTPDFSLKHSDSF